MLPFALAAVLAAPGSDSLPIVSTRVVPSLRPLAMAAAPTGRRVVLTLEDRRTVVIDAATRQVAMTLDSHPLPARAVAWSPDGRWIATGDESARVFLFDAKTGKRVRTIREHQRAIQALSFSPKGDLLASTGADDAVFVFSTETGKKVGTILGKGANVYGGCFTPSGSLLVGTLSNGVMLYLANGQPVAQLGGHPGQGAFGCFPNKAGTLGVSAGRDGIASLWDLRKRTRINSLRGHQDWVTAAAFAPSGAYLATSSTDGTVRFWNPKSFRQIGVLENQARDGSPLAFSADGAFLLTVSDQGFLQVTQLR
ncbi:MAG: WD40 repeat domain-containing protein [Fimbriimonadaceae bacterium]